MVKSLSHIVCSMYQPLSKIGRYISAYNRPRWNKMLFVGRAEWQPANKAGNPTPFLLNKKKNWKGKLWIPSSSSRARVKIVPFPFVVVFDSRLRAYLCHCLRFEIESKPSSSSIRDRARAQTVPFTFVVVIFDSRSTTDLYTRPLLRFEIIPSSSIRLSSLIHLREQTSPSSLRVDCGKLLFSSSPLLSPLSLFLLSLLSCPFYILRNLDCFYFLDVLFWFFYGFHSLSEYPFQF